MSMCHTCKFFGFSISHTILNLPLSIFYLPFMLLIPSTFSRILPSLQHPLPLSSYPWVVQSFLASPFPMLVLTPPCLFWTYHLCFLIPAPFPPLSRFPLPADNPPNDLYIYDSVPVLVVCFIRFVCLFLCFLVRLLIVVNLLSFYCS